MNQTSGNFGERTTVQDQDQGTPVSDMEACSRILVVDDHARSRRGLRALFATCPSTEVICEAADGQEAVSLVEALQPDVVLMDVRMPLLDGLRASRLIKDRWPGVKVILLTAHSTSRAEVVEAGADGYLLKGCPTEELLAAVRKPQMRNERLQ